MSAKTTERTPRDTSKAKPAIAKALGMSLQKLETLSICWVPVPLDSETKLLIEDIAENRSTDEKKEYIYSILSKEATRVIEELREGWVTETKALADKRAKDLTPEEVEKTIAAQERALAKQRAMLEALRAKK